MSRATHPEPSEAAATAHAELCARILRRTQSLFRLVVVACDGSRRLASREADTDIRSVDAMRSVPTIGMAARVGHPLGLSAGQAISVLSDGPVADLDAGESPAYLVTVLDPEGFEVLQVRWQAEPGVSGAARPGQHNAPPGPAPVQCGSVDCTSPADPNGKATRS